MNRSTLSFETRYHHDRLLGDGLILARDTQLRQRQVVLKPCPEVYPAIPPEALTYVRLGNRSNLLLFYDLQYNLDGKAFLILEWLDYRKGWYNLDQVIKSHHARNEPIPLTILLSIFQQLCLALQYIHYKNIIHQDIKTKNIMVRLPQGNDFMPEYPSYHVKVIDFGIATEKGRRRQEGWTIGYASPEQINRREVDFNTDIFSLGVVMYELFTLQQPYQNSDRTFRGKLDLIPVPPPLQNLRSDLHPQLAEIIQKCLLPQSKARFGKVDQLIDAINEFIATNQDLPSENIIQNIFSRLGGRK